MKIVRVVCFMDKQYIMIELEEYKYLRDQLEYLRMYEYIYDILLTQQEQERDYVLELDKKCKIGFQSQEKQVFGSKHRESVYK